MGPHRHLHRRGLLWRQSEAPQLDRLRADVKAKKGGPVLVWKVDRLSRKVSHLSALVDESDQAGVAFRSATEPFDTSHAAGRAFMYMLPTFVELEPETIRERRGVHQHLRIPARIPR